MAVAAAIVVLGGCEVDSAARKIEVRPDAATLRYGQSVTLTAYNGYEYQWSLATPAWGTLSAYSGMMVTYKSLYDPTTPAVQVITVTSTFSDNDTGSSTATNPVVHKAEAYITHIALTDLVTAVSSTP